MDIESEHKNETAKRDRARECERKREKKVTIREYKDEGFREYGYGEGDQRLRESARGP